eukprot:7387416-Prymnesium_polylepis.2
MSMATGFSAAHSGTLIVVRDCESESTCSILRSSWPRIAGWPQPIAQRRLLCVVRVGQLALVRLALCTKRRIAARPYARAARHGGLGGDWCSLSRSE